MWINDVCSPVSILLLIVIEQLLWSYCSAKASQLQPGIMSNYTYKIRLQDI